MMSPIRNFLQKGTIRSRLLVAFILLVLLPTSAVTVTTTFLGLTSGKEIIKKQLFSVAALKRSQVSFWLDLLEKDLGIILSVTRLKEIFEESGNEIFSGNKKDEFKNLQHNLNEIFQKIGSFEEVFFLSSSGYVMISTYQKSIGRFLGFHPTFSKEGKSAGVYVQTHAFSSDYNLGNKLVAVHPVQNSREELVGVFCGLAGMTHLNEIMSESTGLGRTGETYLVGKNRVLLTRLRLAEYPLGNVLVSSEGINAALDRHESGSGIYTDYRGTPVLGVYLWIPEIEAALLSEMDKYEAYIPIYLMLALNVGMGVLALIVAGILSIFFARGIADPLSELANTSTRIASGELYLNVKQDRKDEIGALAKAFNTMADQMSHRLETYKLISDMSREFISISSTQIDRAVYRALKTFGQYYGADRSYVFQISGDSDLFTKTHEWKNGENEKKLHPMQMLPVSQINQWFMNGLTSMKVIHVPSVEELPQEAVKEKAQWLFKDVRSFICIPMFFGESLRGFIGFDFLTESRKLYEEDKRFLRMLGEIICNSLERQNTEAALKRSREQYALAQRAARIGSLDLDLNTGKLYCSDTTWSILGGKKGDVEPTFDFFLLMVHPEDRDILGDAIQKSIEEKQHYDIEHRILLPDGSVRWVLMTGAVIKDETGTPARIIGMIRDITERKESAEKINASLREKEVLLKEIHHRVKNNLQVISSLMFLQSNSVKDKNMAGIFKDCESRIRSMALVHERLYQSKSMAEIDFADYVKSLAGYLVQSYGGAYESISLKINIDNIFLNVNAAIPCGLIISELVSNALKHAYPDGKKGEIVISFTRDEAGTYIQTVRDNGVGLPENLDFQNTDTLGLKLVNILAKQLNGSLTYSCKEGACFVLTFNEPVFSNAND